MLASSKAEIGGPVYRAVSRFMLEIDILAEALTGDRTYLHIGPCGRETPKGPKPQVWDAEFEKARRRYDPPD